ncbi:PIG-L deacetylase family protein [Marinobacterium jannaschii]|uniref:PIG-L deacetylase family protein n=1 Tax=Marinobacterium jannaschii TaxID=64970 RepID=UPI000559F12A|nr:PIG-L deacetylase family protein [Marinobacterium jannaschii]
MITSENIAIIVAHPDDEVLGCGGTIARLCEAGKKVHTIFLSDGETARYEAIASDIGKRQLSAVASSEALGSSRPYFLGFPDNEMDKIPLLTLVKALEKLLVEIKPDTIITHHSGDLNIDHRLTFQAVMTACRPQPGYFVKNILSCEVLSSTEWQAPGTTPFQPNFFFDISKHFSAKLKALKAYESEMRPAPHSRSLDNVEALARFRGHAIGTKYAEAFILHRCII